MSTVRGLVALSPDEKRMVSDRGAGPGRLDLWTTELEHGTESRLTFNGYNVAPVWSPDGDYVAFASGRGGSVDLYRQAANQAGPEELLLRRGVPTDWSRTGFIIFSRQSSSGNDSDLFALPINGDKQPVPLLHSESNEIQGKVSYDGRWLAYTSDESGRYEVYVQPFAPTLSKPSTGKWQISIGGGRDPHWNGDGREMFYLAPNGKMMAVAVKTDGDALVHSTPQPLFEARLRFPVDVTTISHYAVSADGQRFLMAPNPETSSEATPLHVTVNWLAGLKR